MQKKSTGKNNFKNKKNPLDKEATDVKKIVEEQSNFIHSTLQNYLRVRRIRTVLPFIAFIFLFGIIIVLQSWITSEGNIIKEQKAKELTGKKAPVNVVALEVTPGPIREQISLPGVVRPWIELSVVSEVRGKIISKEVTEGRRVKAGDILARIDDRNYQNAFSSAQAGFRAAKAAHDRILTLNQDRLATQSQLDDALAGMERAKANLDTAALNLEHCTIASPMEGIVDKVYIEKGQFMNETNPVADILQIDKVKVQVSIPESDVDAVRQVKNFTVIVDALKNKRFSGSMHYLAKSSQSLSHSYLLEVAVENPNAEILPDMFSRVTIVKHEVENGLAIPLFAIINAKDSKAVYVAENGVARLRPITTGIQEGWQVEAREGLQPGTKVIVVGHKDVKEGAPINLLRTVSDSKELSQ